MNAKTILAKTGAFAAIGIGQVSAAPAWYDITFTGVDIYTVSTPDNTQTPAQQSSPRAAYDLSSGKPVLMTSTYGANGALGTYPPGGAFSFPGGFVIDQINLYGGNSPSLSATKAWWGETYVADLWQDLKGPTGWSTVVQPTPDGNLPTWENVSGSSLNFANQNSFTFSAEVLIDNPGAILPNGMLRVFFAAFDNNDSNPALYNTEVDGAMGFYVTPVPDPGASFGLLTIALACLCGFRGWGWVFRLRCQLCQRP
jgi:hypothetical protein